MALTAVWSGRRVGRSPGVILTGLGIFETQRYIQSSFLCFPLMETLNLEYPHVKEGCPMSARRLPMISNCKIFMENTFPV